MAVSADASGIDTSNDQGSTYALDDWSDGSSAGSEYDVENVYDRESLRKAYIDSKSFNSASEEDKERILAALVKRPSIPAWDGCFSDKNLNLTKILLGVHPEETINRHCEHFGQTCLHRATLYHASETMKLLLATGANPRNIDINSMTAWDKAIQNHDNVMMRPFLRLDMEIKNLKVRKFEGPWKFYGEDVQYTGGWYTLEDNNVGTISWSTKESDVLTLESSYSGQPYAVNCTFVNLLD